MINLIKENRVKDLSSQVFEQTIEGTGTYTRCMYEDEENAVVEQFLKTEGSVKKEWGNFIKRYIKHYPLFNSSEDILTKNVYSGKDVLCAIWARYGCPEKVAIEVCQSALKDNRNLSSLLINLCRASKTFSSQVFNLLEKIDFSYAERKIKKDVDFASYYSKRVQLYHKKNKLPGF